MTQKLSYTAINTFSTCGHKYYLKYKKNLRGKYFHASLAFGSAIDASLNKLLLTKDIEEAKAEFDKQWHFQWVNKKYVALPEYTDIVYAESDFDADLLNAVDRSNLELKSLDENGNTMTYESVLAQKKKIGWDNLSESSKKYFNYANWLSMYTKGIVMLDSYNKKVMPHIKEVLAVQKENYLQNQSGDKVVQYLDLIVKWEDGRNILFDNKTSAKDYEEDQASRSPQLVSYYHGAKDQYNLDAVGFLVLKKGLTKNKIKKCTVCNHDGSEGRHKTCANTIDGKRCNGSWNETINPECYIQIIINKVTTASEDLVLSSFDEASDGIKKENWYKNLSACKNGPIVCEFFDVCWKGDYTKIVDVSKT